MKVDKELAQQVFLEFYGIDPKYVTFKTFVESLKNSKNIAIIESIVEGINVIIEAANVAFLRQMGISPNDIDRDETKFKEMLKNYHDAMQLPESERSPDLYRTEQRIKTIIFRKLLFLISKREPTLKGAEELYARCLETLPSKMDELLNFYNQPESYSFENELNKLVLRNSKSEEHIVKGEAHEGSLIRRTVAPKTKGQVKAINDDGTLRVAWFIGDGRTKIDPTVNPDETVDGKKLYDIYDKETGIQTVSMNKSDDNDEGESTEMINNIAAPDDALKEENISSRKAQVFRHIDKQSIPENEKSFLKAIIDSENIGQYITDELNTINKKILYMKDTNNKGTLNRSVEDIAEGLTKLSSAYTNLIKIFDEYNAVSGIDPEYMPTLFGLKQVESKQYSELEKVVKVIIPIGDNYYIPAKSSGSENGKRESVINIDRIGASLFGIKNAQYVWNNLKTSFRKKQPA